MAKRLENESPISRVKYVNSNSILTDNEQNQVFKKFINFVERMLLFYSLDSRGYEGFMNGSESIAEGIVNSGKVQDFQEFLKQNDIEYPCTVLLLAYPYGKSSVCLYR